MSMSSILNDCPLCAGAGFLRDDLSLDHPDFGHPIECECSRVQRRAELWEQIWWRGYKSARLTDFARSIRQQVAGAVNAGRGLYICGPNGVGKTHLAMAILREFGEELDGQAVLVATLLDRVRAAFNPETKEVAAEVLDRFAAIPFLVLDDIGAEKPTPWAQEALFRLVYQREANRDRITTIFTSNLTTAELAGFYDVSGQRITSRIEGMCGVIALAGADRRRRKE